MMHADYENLGYLSLRRRLVEGYATSTVIDWFRTIESQLVDKHDEATNAGNDEDADKLRAFLVAWRVYDDGKLSVEELQGLVNMASLMSVETWAHRNYFTVLKAELLKLLASASSRERRDSASDQDVAATDPLLTQQPAAGIASPDGQVPPPDTMAPPTETLQPLVP